MENKEQQIVDIIKNKITENNLKPSEEEIKNLIKNEIINLDYMKVDDWHIDYAINRIYPIIHHHFLYENKVVKNNKLISVERADKKASNALSSAYILIIINFLGFFTRKVVITHLIFAIIGFIFINFLANKALDNNTSIPETALKAKKLGTILLIIGSILFLVRIF